MPVLLPILLSGPCCWDRRSLPSASSPSSPATVASDIEWSQFRGTWRLKRDGLNSNHTLDLASSLDVGCATNRNYGETSPSDCSSRSVLTIAFQFSYEVNLQDSVVVMARQYVRTIVSSVQRVAMAISPSRLDSNVGDKHLTDLPEAVTLSRWICQSYKRMLFYWAGLSSSNPIAGFLGAW